MSAGLVVVDKPGGLTSHDVVARIRRLAGTRKVGHAGTLDPMATGVLVVGVGRATRLLGHLALTEKSYDATIRLGEATVTDDAEGEFLRRSDAGHLDPDQVRAVLDVMVGEVEQVPSAVSAVKVDGRRSYDRVRAGEQVDLAPRRVRIDEITLHGFRAVDGLVDLDVSVRCSSGTYIRAIARDLGAALQVGGHLTALRRTSVGPFRLELARTLDDLAERFETVPVAEAARRAFASRDLTEQEAGAVRVGRRLPLDLGGPHPTALFAPDGEFLALYRTDGDVAVPVAVFVG